MNKFNLKILEFSRDKDVLSVGLRVRGPYDAKVRNPKVTIIFDNGTETRRIPVVVQAYFPEESMESFTIFAKYDYLLSCLFYNQPVNENLEVWFEVIYGEETEARIPFTISGDVELDEDDHYDIRVDAANDSFHMQLQPEFLVVKKKNPVLHVAQGILSFVWTLLLTLVAIPLAVLFGIESLLVMLGCLPGNKAIKGKGLTYPIHHVRWRVNSFVRRDFGIVDAKLRVLHMAFAIASKGKVKQNRVTFISNRRNDLTGNFEFVHDILKKDDKLDIRFVLDNREIRKMSFWHIWQCGRYVANSKVILVDDYISLLFQLPRRPGTNMFQLWHACGMFKTFGYSRMGKPGGQEQTSVAHRIYDGATVSCREAINCHAEGFGISDDKVVATGIPRTDIFFDADYKVKIQQAFYAKYPKLKKKKILLFAPTFRGDGKRTGYYPVERFDLKRVYEELDGEYAILVKHHPYVKNRTTIPAEYSDYIIDMSKNSELNDLLFVTDLLITDYSSVIFEAALLDIPMLFFAYDLQRYISTRGFYKEYEDFVPGKIVGSLGQVLTAIKENDFEADKIPAFKTKFFDDLDGKSAERVADWIYETLKK